VPLDPDENGSVYSSGDPQEPDHGQMRLQKEEQGQWMPSAGY